MSDAKSKGPGAGKPLPGGGGQAPGVKPRQSTTGWGNAAPARPSNTGSGGPRISMTGGGSRASFRKTTRASRSQTGEPTERALQIIVDGVDRTPKPLLSIKPTVLKGGPSDDSVTPNSEASEFFMDRMSVAFGKSGWYSNADSGSHSPKSEADYDYEAEKKDRDRKAAAEQAAQIADVSNNDGTDTPPGAAVQADGPAPPALLHEKDLERNVSIYLQETETVFILQMPGVTVALDSDEAKAVEEQNRRYANLLHTKQAADKYVDAEAQTLVMMKKTREVQSAVLETSETACQATVWDISDQVKALDEAAADAEDDHRGGAAVPNINQLAGGAAHYQAPARGSGGPRSGALTDMAASTRGSVMGGAGPSARPSMYMGGPPGGQSYMTTGASYMGGPSFMSGYGAAAGSSMSGAVGPSGTPPTGGAAAAVDQLAPPPDPLAGLPGLLEALTIMDHAINQNNYLAQLLLYRDVQAHPGSSGAGLYGRSHGGARSDDADSDAMSHLGMRPTSAAASDGGRSHAESTRSANPQPRHSLSRQPSERSVAVSRAMSMRDPASPAMDRTHSMLMRQGHANNNNHHPQVNYAASVAESNWPEELLQELADLGDDAPRMEHLWDWTCPLTAGKTVACMGWNKANPDLLAVGYGCYSFPTCAGGTDEKKGEQNSKGLVAFWSLKNPEFPLWWFEAKSAVTALDFSTYSPNILALGLYDGTIAIYDIKSRQGTASMECDVHSGKHADPVWKVRWLDRGPERDEPLVSISTDGRVTQWSIAKGLEFSDLMKLKRVARRGSAATPAKAAAAPGAPAAATAAAAAEQQDAFISRLTSGMAFDFSSRDERIYVAATEDGWLHKCSTSYSEQYLESYRGHMGPVYQVQFSPYKNDMFISASGDWTLRMWQEGRDTPLLTFQASSTEINDVQWCPTNSTVFGNVTSSGRLEIWDFALSTVKPVMHVKGSPKLSCLVFSPTCPVVVCGGDDGSVKVYRLINIAREYETTQEQLERLDDVIRANVMKQTTSLKQES